MSDTNRDLIQLLVEKVQDNNDKLDEIKESYYNLKYMFASHHETDEKMHEQISEFIQSANQRLDTYNRQLEIHIAATEDNREQLNAFKTSFQPLLNSFVEEQAVKKVAERKLKSVKLVLGVITGFITIVGAVIGIWKALN